MRIVLAAVVAGSAMLAGACGGDEQRALSGQQLTPPTEVGSLSLPEAGSGEPFSFSASSDHLLLTYFGYTSCPDVCPTTLAGVKAALRDLGTDAERIELAMVTIDPARDTPERLPGYVESFVADGVGLRTDDDATLRAVADTFGASYEVTPADDGGEPEVSHSGALYVVDDTGRVVLVWPFGVSSDDIASDLEILLEDRA
jgi:protein SCO1/2